MDREEKRSDVRGSATFTGWEEANGRMWYPGNQVNQVL